MYSSIFASSIPTVVTKYPGDHTTFSFQYTLGYGGDISLSIQYDTLFDMQYVLITKSPLSHHSISPPTHSPTGKPVELCPSGYWYRKYVGTKYEGGRIPSGDWDRHVVASYAKGNVLLSGWLFGEDVIARKAAVVDIKHKKGHIILIGFPSQHRAQSHGTYKFLLNALLYPEVN